MADDFQHDRDCALPRHTGRTCFGAQQRLEDAEADMIEAARRLDRIRAAYGIEESVLEHLAAETKHLPTSFDSRSESSKEGQTERNSDSEPSTHFEPPGESWRTSS